MSSIKIQSSTLALFVAMMPSLSLAAPLSHLYKREMTTGAKAGLGVGLAVAALAVIGLIIFFVVHFKRSRHLAAMNKERAILAGEKNADGTDKIDKFAEQPAQPLKRNKSVKDRLMGPLYRGSTIDMIPLPKAHTDNPNRGSTATMQFDENSFIHKPWAENSPRPSFSSKRATRMMMMM